MLIFATPDFGTSGGIALMLLIAWAIVFGLVLAGMVWGVRIVSSKTTRRKVIGVVLLLVSGAIPFTCCLGPPYCIRIVYGNYPIGSYPIGKIQKGMTTDEVAAALGTPHHRYRQGDEERWHYWIDS